VLLRHEIADAVEVFAISGPIDESDAVPLEAELRRALELNPRGIVVDLSLAGPFSPAALAVLRRIREQARGWPRPALLLCGLPDDIGAQLGAPAHFERSEALAHVDDRSTAPRRRFEFGHSLESPCAARAAVVEAAGELQIGGLSEDLQLVVSELVTNAIRYAQPPVQLEIEAGEDSVTVAVLDGSPGRPTAKEQRADAEGGRGLHLVDLVAAETGVRPQPPGKTMWAELSRL
jgi:anti-sigma regulatory factor (Ser/Thr protein kinase)